MSSPRRVTPLEILVFFEGAGTLGAEIAGARLLAPWFGASTIVWANTIATVLVALAVGYALGGRLADRNPRPAVLAVIVGVASALIATVPFVSGPFLHAAVTGVDELNATGFVGSLFGVAALLAVPLVLLGMVSPYAIRLKTDQLGHDADRAGRVAGRMFAISTVGSLVGNFVAALVLIPLVGTRRTFLIFALAMACAACGLLGRRWWWGAIEAAVLVALIALPVGVIKSGAAAGDAAGSRVVYEAETEYQYARVLESASGVRTLELNEGHAVHSVYRPGEYLTRNYWDELLAAAFASERGVPERVAILGNAGGTAARALAHYEPGTRIDAVELDPEVSAIGRDWFDMTAPSIAVHTADARPWLLSAEGGYDVIVVDAYRQPYVPFYLTTHEFFSLVRERLAPGGVLVVNSAHPEGSEDLEKVLTATVESAGFTVWRDASEPTNTVLIGATGSGLPAERLDALAADLPDDLRPLVRATAARLAPGLEGGTVYTDDRAPVEWLVDLSLAAVAG